MSRLDDELRIAFKREQPPADFAARVLERINEPPASKKNWWARLAEMFETPKLRWVAIGVAASLLVAIGVAQYRGSQVTPVERTARLPESAPAPAASAAAEIDESMAESMAAPGPAVAAAPRHRQIKRRDAAREPALNRPRLAGAPKAPPVSAEAEAAKERVLFALQIVDSMLTDARRVIQEDGAKPKPETLHTR